MGRGGDGKRGDDLFQSDLTIKHVLNQIYEIVFPCLFQYPINRVRK